MDIDYELLEKVRFAYVKERMGLKTVAKLYDVPLSVVRFWKQRDKALGTDWDKAKDSLKALEASPTEKKIEEVAKELLENISEEVEWTMKALRQEHKLDAKTKTGIISDLTQSFSRAVGATKTLIATTSEFATAIKVLGLFAQHLEKNAPDLLPEFSSHLEVFAKSLETTLK